MKKRGAIILFFAVFFILNLNWVYAVGLSPAITNINFKPGLVTSIKYTVYEENPEREIEISATGPLAKYVELDKESIIGAGSFTATIRFPDKIDTPGENMISIGVKEKPPEGVGLGTLTAINVVVLVFVPYPGKYAEIEKFSVENVNEGENLTFNTEVSSLGENDIVAELTAELSLYDDRYIETIELGRGIVESQGKRTFQKIINSSRYGTGDYNATAILDYGTERIVRKETHFKIGSLFVDILNWTKEAYYNELNEFYVEVESNWNNKVENVHAEVFVYEKGNETNKLSEFKTVSESLDKWQSKNLTGYLDTAGIKPGVYEMNITIFYEGASTIKITDITIKRKIAIWVIVTGIVGIIVLITIIFIITWIIIKKRKEKIKNGKR